MLHSQDRPVYLYVVTLLPGQRKPPRTKFQADLGGGLAPRRAAFRLTRVRINTGAHEPNPEGVASVIKTQPCALRVRPLSQELGEGKL